ncbi:MAG TPA: DUF3996 domain-containing protein [Spirochaetota bacterium]|nr:DUF3996 domain-containing protein [Spirochaetota bacterium]HOM08527.1 DUF3996 domain-containing protein [Spirochaetota bacterium]HPP48346.1 DUF3996 domain-containing protein [Spirochaetota bacterium]HXK65006.1 DUF3996 domain-containing protein [Spirochaetota bacterium]
MKNILLPCIFVLMFATIASAAHNFGAGFILGDPSGLTAKIFMGKSDAIDIGIGESADDLYIYADYLRHFHGVFPINELVFYLGVGAGFHDWEKDRKNDHDEENRIDVRIPVGLEYTFTKVPVGIFIELVPALRIIPDVDFDIRGGLGARYYF